MVELSKRTIIISIEVHSVILSAVYKNSAFGKTLLRNVVKFL